MSTLFSHFSEKINQISPLEAKYTEVLSTIAVMPKMLYFYGKMPENVVKNGKERRPPTVAVVGARRNTSYGEEVAYKMAYELAKNGVIIVSGLAYGIDSIAHRAALDAGGVTIAVLGTPIDHIYPTRHKALAKEIIAHGGTVISEYAPGTDVFPKTSFLERNRIISGLSDAVLVVEAAERSGSLNTATHALSQGREVFAVPGNIASPLSAGCNKLISQGANPCTAPDDILFTLGLTEVKKRHSKQKIQGDNNNETLILAALANGAKNGEDIIVNTGLAAATFNETMTILEIKGVVRSLGANKWALI